MSSGIYMCTQEEGNETSFTKFNCFICMLFKAKKLYS